MRPLTLKMTAFGPYKYTEVIDFTELDQHQLFVISGNTGSGKTTIFDGICFALYGTASGQDRESQNMLRSDFADDDGHTAVELEFELNGHIYRILRQLGHVKQGNKSKTGDRYEFFEKVNGKEIPCVDRQIVSEIDKKVETLMGLTQSQFKQIVMLPQGEFRKFLTSDTENKEEILRKLFKTESYMQINERLQNRKNKIEKDFNQAKNMKDNFIQHIYATLPYRDTSIVFQVLSNEHYNVNQVAAGLEKETLFYEQQIIEDQKKYEVAYKTHGQKQAAYHGAKLLNNRLEELDRKQTKLQELQGQKISFLKKEEQLQQAEQANQIEPYELQARSWKKEEAKKSVTLRQVKQAKIEADQALGNATSIYRQEEKKKTVREEIGRKLDRLKEFLPIVKEVDDVKQQLAIQKNKAQKSLATLEKIRMGTEEKNKAMATYSEKIKRMDEAVSHLPDKQTKLTKMEEKRTVVKKYMKVTDQQTELDKEVQVNEKKMNEQKTKYMKLEKIWLNNQASILASHLHDGEACPVCGSAEHPRKATTDEKVITRDQLDVLKEEVDQQDALYRNALAKQHANKLQLDEKIAEISPYRIRLEEVPAVMNQLAEEKKPLKEEVEKLKHSRKELATLKQAYEKVYKEYTDLQSEEKTIDRGYQEQKTSYETNHAVFKERLRVIPAEVRVLSVLEGEIKETEKQKGMIEKAWEEAQHKLRVFQEEYTTAVADLTHAEKQLIEIREKRTKAVKQFTEALAEANFVSEQTFHQAKMPFNERKILKKEMDRYHQEVSTLYQQVHEEKTALKDRDKVDLETLEQQLEQFKQAYELAFKTLSSSEEYKAEAIKLKRNIVDATKQVNKYEKQLSIITDLYDVIRGQNGQKISFERYLQIGYLEQIIEAANQRLKHVSNGQYLLKRSDRQESHGRQSGLALDVNDEYTGQTRDVKTLSGGEKFNASLCLALGMSDVIQSFQGNISISTMFIDEGFGSLDEESLHKSIDVLIDLQESGRMIGVISHVQELKNLFPAVLEVTKVKEGYSETQFLFK